jgi:hypothetical protein
MLYDIGCVDNSGRVASNHIIDALRWQPGSKLDVILTPRTIVIRAAPDGQFCVPRTVIFRRRDGDRTGHQPHYRDMESGASEAVSARARRPARSGSDIPPPPSTALGCSSIPPPPKTEQASCSPIPPPPLTALASCSPIPPPPSIAHLASADDAV